MKNGNDNSIQPDYPKYHLGFDIGSISVNAVVIDNDQKVVENRYEYCHGKPFDVA